ncbi:hypothetical protein KAR48_20630 [bacterium]|nr:hypothetical protein [bacterium]
MIDKRMNIRKLSLHILITSVFILMLIPISRLNGECRSYFSDSGIEEYVWLPKAIEGLRFGVVERFKSILQNAHDAGSLPEWLLEYDKNLLDSATQNSIIFTSGNLDTLGIWYWQYIKGYRRDLTIIPIGLVEKPWFLIQLKEKRYIHPGGVHFSWSRIEILNNEWPLWQGEKIFAKYPDYPLDIAYLLLQNNHVYPEKSLSAIFNIIENNSQNKDLYFSPNLKTDFLVSFQKHLSQSALLYKLQKSASVQITFDLDRTMKWARKDGRLTSIINNPEFSSDSLAHHYAGVYTRLSDALKANGRDKDVSFINSQIQKIKSGRLFPPDL